MRTAHRGGNHSPHGLRRFTRRAIALSHTKGNKQNSRCVVSGPVSVTSVQTEDISSVVTIRCKQLVRTQANCSSTSVRRS